MQSGHKEVLLRRRVKLVEELSLNEEFITHMRSAKILLPSHRDEIMSYRTNMERVTTFLRILAIRGPKAMEVFIEGLVKTHQVELGYFLDSELTQQYVDEYEKAITTRYNRLCHADLSKRNDPFVSIPPGRYKIGIKSLYILETAPIQRQFLHIALSDDVRQMTHLNHGGCASGILKTIFIEDENSYYREYERGVEYFEIDAYTCHDLYCRVMNEHAHLQNVKGGVMLEIVPILGCEVAVKSH
jgi:hypothetical protein